MSMIVLSLDPGETTGYAIGEVGDGFLRIREIGQAELSTSGLWHMLGRIEPFTIVAESFEYRPKYRTESKLNLFPCYLLGVLCLWTELRNIRLCLQSASTGKGYFNDTKLKTEGVYSVKAPHGRDATRHLCHWFTFGAGYKYNYPASAGNPNDKAIYPTNELDLGGKDRSEAARKAAATRKVRTIPKGEIPL